jgi:cell division septum initiation protein DivIVA
MIIFRCDMKQFLLLAIFALGGCASDHNDDQLYDELDQLTERNKSLEADNEELKNQLARKDAMIEEMGSNIRASKKSLLVERRLDARDKAEREEIAKELAEIDNKLNNITGKE